MSELKAVPGPYATAKYSKKRFGIGRAGEGAFAFIQPLYTDADDEVMKATVRLFKAAPDLYEALSTLVASIRQPISVQMTNDQLALIGEATLKKARGEA